MAHRRIVALTILLASLASAQHWEFEQVDTAGNWVAVEAFATVDAEMDVYYGAGWWPSTHVVHAHRDTIWRLDTLPGPSHYWDAASRLDGRQAVIMRHSSELKLFELAGDTWEISVPPQYGALAYDSAGDLSILGVAGSALDTEYICLALHRDSMWLSDTAWMDTWPYADASVQCFVHDRLDHPYGIVRWWHHTDRPVSAVGIDLLHHDGPEWQLQRIDGGSECADGGYALAARPDSGVQYCYSLGPYGHELFHVGTDTVEDAYVEQASLCIDATGRVHAAYVLPSGHLVYATEDTSGWQKDTVATSVSDCAIVILMGQPAIAYLDESGVWLARRTPGAVAERTQPILGPGPLAPTICRGVLRIGSQPKADGRQPELVDVTGRKVMDLRPGANDVSSLAPGIYFVREEGPRIQGSEGSRIRKVVVTR